MRDASTSLLWFESVSSHTAAATHLAGTKRRLEATGIKVVSEVFSTSVGNSIISRIYRLTKLVYRARVAAGSADVMVARWHPFLAFVTGAWLKKDKRVVLLVQGTDDSTYESNPWLRKVPFAKKLIKSSLVKGSEWLVLNQGVRDWILGAYNIPSDKVSVLPTGVSDVFLTTRASPPSQRKYVVFFGALARWQGIEVLLAASKSAQWPEDVALTIIGDGETRELVEDTVSQRVTYLGSLPQDQIPEIASQAIATLCPKLDHPSMANTTTPFKMLESAAMGVPVIASDIPAQRKILEQGEFGLLAKVSDPEDLALQVRILSEDLDLRQELATKALLLRDKLSWEYDAAILADAVHGC